MSIAGPNWEDHLPKVPGTAALMRRVARQRARTRSLQERAGAAQVALIDAERALAHAVHHRVGPAGTAVDDAVARARAEARGEPEAIACAAILADDGTMVTVPRPGRHHHLIFAMTHNGHGPIGPDAQGFSTTRGRFVDRREGLAIASAMGQVVHKHPSYDMLYSEDMW